MNRGFVDRLGWQVLTSARQVQFLPKWHSQCGLDQLENHLFILIKACLKTSRALTYGV